MTKRLGLILSVVLSLLTISLIAADGPLTNFLNLRGRTDASGYLITTGGGYTAPDGPLTALGNLRARTDANGYLITSMNGPQLFSDGTSGAPSIAFASEPTLGFWRSGAAQITAQATTLITSGNISVGNAVNSTSGLNITGKWKNTSPTDGIGVWTNNAATIGFELKADALPTISSGCGTSPSVFAGSTPLAGGVNIGTGGTATQCVIAFNGTAYPSAPFCVANNVTSNTVTRILSSTTTLTLNTTTAWSSGEIVAYLCIGAK